MKVFLETSAFPGYRRELMEIREVGDPPVKPTAVTALEWAELAQRLAGEALEHFPDLSVIHTGDCVHIEGAGGATAGQVRLVPLSPRFGRARFEILRSPTHALTGEEVRQLFDRLHRLVECGKWLERRLDMLVILG
jgi:hypothetical protein